MFELLRRRRARNEKSSVASRLRRLLRLMIKIVLTPFSATEWKWFIHKTLELQWSLASNLTLTVLAVLRSRQWSCVRPLWCDIIEHKNLIDCSLNLINSFPTKKELRSIKSLSRSKVTIGWLLRKKALAAILTQPSSVRGPIHVGQRRSSAIAYSSRRPPKKDKLTWSYGPDTNKHNEDEYGRIVKFMRALLANSFPLFPHDVLILILASSLHKSRRIAILFIWSVARWSLVISRASRAPLHSLCIHKFATHFIKIYKQNGSLN